MSFLFKVESILKSNFITFNFTYFEAWLPLKLDVLDVFQCTRVSAYVKISPMQIQTPGF